MRSQTPWKSIGSSWPTSAFVVGVRIGSGSRDDVGGLSIPRLWHRYGTESRVVQAIMRSHPDLAVAARPDSTYILGEVVYAARYEMACSIDDPDCEACQ